MSIIDGTFHFLAFNPCNKKIYTGANTVTRTDGHSGPGLYAHFEEYPEEGSVLLSEAEEQDQIQEYTVCLLFRNNATEVALIEKTHPAWQAGRLNGIGGKKEPGESLSAAVTREFEEEAGVSIDTWERFCVLNHNNRVIHYFRAHGDYDLHSMTEEKVGWYKIKDLPGLPIIPNLLWLIPMALDKDSVTAIVEDLS